MSLTGNLEVFPLEEILRMLARSRKAGCLRVNAVGQLGRVFLAGGALTFATVGSDEEVRRQILNAGLVMDEDFRKVDLSGAALTQVLAPGVSSSALTDFVREQIVESLFRIRKEGTGNFEFVVDLAARYPTGQSFDVEVAVGETERRSAEWSDIETVVPDMATPYRMVRELADDGNITINPHTWRLLARIESGASANGLADRLGLSRFRAASELANMVRNQLLEVATETAVQPDSVAAVGPAPVPAPLHSAPLEEVSGPAVVEVAASEEELTSPVTLPPSGWEPSGPPVWSNGWADHAADDAEMVPAAAPDEALGNLEEPPVPDSWWDTGTSIWDTPQVPEHGTSEDGAQSDGDGPDDDQAELQSDGESETLPDPVPVAEEKVTDPTAGWWSETMAPTAPTEVLDSTDDADRFLESVFSQLNEATATPAESVEEDTNFGLGLLRRRRMGTAARDISSQ